MNKKWYKEKFKNNIVVLEEKLSFYENKKNKTSYDEYEIKCLKSRINDLEQGIKNLEE